MSMDMPNTTSAPPVGRIQVQTAAPDLGEMLLRLLEAREREIKARRQALEAEAREIGQLLATLRRR